MKIAASRRRTRKLRFHKNPPIHNQLRLHLDTLLMKRGRLPGMRIQDALPAPFRRILTPVLFRKCPLDAAIQMTLALLLNGFAPLRTLQNCTWTMETRKKRFYLITRSGIRLSRRPPTSYHISPNQKTQVG